ncbi:multidrug Oligosaccharidyl-lipid polysaccharide flippase [Coniophora puteana RWD-64-598 SS2]|uniref:Multidrug Oligosaccharidyl-lipid polysaccharide flippase n=1 Tax=Coniophora puteana (strain RWD-64-598) TaxID=741705 RepID=A0A5M3MK85_CONPW|nr:multidrug Oligosaccharidyl-lipid polysaccharide flippase [Coniophora puteana RWD-64-598 SS2]EIW79476.1 multidrug Oligosaccharidyl-lipid polysaccharide flippase [Coniophora puteana RWD-64-598 SS2]
MLLEELKTLVKYTLPVYGTHLLEHSLILASVVSIGHLSTIALAASTLGFMTVNVTGFSIVQGLASTLDTLLPGAWTSEHPQLVGLWTQRMIVVGAATMFPILAIWFNSEPILLLLRQDPEVAHLASVYLKWESLGLPAYTFNCISRRYFQAQGLFAVPTRIIIAVAPINILLNYLLVWGPEPIRLGFIGAPIATSISYNLISIASIVYGVWFVDKRAWHPISRRCLSNLGIVVKLGFAGVGQVASEWWSWELSGLGCRLGPTALAAQSVLLSSASTTFQAPFALSVATSVRVGNLLGEARGRRAGISANASIVTTFIVFRNKWAYLFNSDTEVVHLVASVLPLVALFQVFDGICGVTAGILRARGMQFTGAVLNLSAYYVVGIPFGVFLTLKRDMGLQGLWIGITVALVYGAAVSLWLCLRSDWEKEVRKVRERLEVDKKAMIAETVAAEGDV